MCVDELVLLLVVDKEALVEVEVVAVLETEKLAFSVEVICRVSDVLLVGGVEPKPENSYTP